MARMVEPGTVLQNRYVVERQIGAGGMGAVYVATDRRFGSTVALKETFFDDPALRKAFEREARLLNRLRHTALPRVSDHFEEAEGQFLVMEYIPGEDLSQMLKARGGSGFPARQVLTWADQLLDALEYLHTQEPPVIHRDIKPQNLKLTSRDQIVLLDFGLAKGAPLQTRATNTASLFGYSFNYAPIEQMQGAGTDPRSDLYSLGATLYHLLTGAPPADALTRATAVLDGDPDPLRPAGDAAAHVPAEVSQVLSRSMALSAARRFGSAEEMRAALRDAAQTVARTSEAAGAATLVPGVGSEQKTRLMDSGPARTSAHEPRAHETRPAVAQEAATLLNDGAATARTNARGAEPTTVEGADGKSVVTRVRAADAQPTARSRRAFYVVFGLVCLVLAAVSSSWFMQGASTVEPAAQPTPQPAAQSTPPESVPPSTQQATEATPTPAAAPAAAQKRATAAPMPKSAQPEAERPAQPEPRTPPPGTPPLPPEAANDPLLRGRDLQAQPLTREEWRAIFRRAAEERRRAMQERDRILQEQRRQRRLEQQQRRNNNAYPPAPPPPDRE